MFFSTNMLWKKKWTNINPKPNGSMQKAGERSCRLRLLWHAKRAGASPSKFVASLRYEFQLEQQQVSQLITKQNRRAEGVERLVFYAIIRFTRGIQKLINKESWRWCNFINLTISQVKFSKGKDYEGRIISQQKPLKTSFFQCSFCQCFGWSFYVSSRNMYSYEINFI